MKYFVNKGSIVRKIWGRSDVILFIFAGAAAEFALNKAIDWLYFTGRLPADPLERLFSTVTYAQRIVFQEQQAALSAIDQITAIHKNVEDKRGQSIPDWAYRDVLFMLIDYSIRAYELLERKLSEDEKAEVFTVFIALGHRMELKGLPGNYREWVRMRGEHLKADLSSGKLTKDLFLQYKKQLGAFRYFLLRQVQALLVPGWVRKLLSLNRLPLIWPVVQFYRFSRLLHIEHILKNLILPPAYKARIAALDVS